MHFSGMFSSLATETGLVTRVTKAGVVQGVRENIGATCMKCLHHIIISLKRGASNDLRQKRPFRGDTLTELSNTHDLIRNMPTQVWVVSTTSYHRVLREMQFFWKDLWGTRFRSQ